MSRARGRLAALAAAAAVVATLAACGGGSEGTVVAKNQYTDDYACGETGGAVSAPSAFPVLKACTDPTCWQLVIRGSDGAVSRTCVSRGEYAATPVGAFWHGRTDR